MNGLTLKRQDGVRKTRYVMRKRNRGFNGGLISKEASDRREERNVLERNKKRKKVQYTREDGRR